MMMTVDGSDTGQEDLVAASSPHRALFVSDRRERIDQPATFVQ